MSGAFVPVEDRKGRDLFFFQGSISFASSVREPGSDLSDASELSPVRKQISALQSKVPPKKIRPSSVRLRRGEQDGELSNRLKQTPSTDARQDGAAANTSAL